ncbi:reverse transcriptase domain-containing protein [Tanacetum coccineum]
MSSASTVTYASIYTDSEPGRVFWGADEELSDGGSPRVIVYGYDRLPMQPVDPPSPDYVPGPEHPSSPDYVPGPEHPPSLAEVPYIPEPEYPEYLVPSDDEEDPEEDPEEDHADYPADEGDGDDEPSDDDDDDTNDEDKEPLRTRMMTRRRKPFKTDESVATPPTHRTTARISIRPEAHMPFPSEEEVERLLALPPPPPSSLISLSPPSAKERLVRCLAAPAFSSSPLSIVPHPYGSPNHVCAPPGFRAAMGRLRASSPSTHHPLHSSPPLPPPLSSLYLPPHVPTSLPLPSSPLPPLPASLFISPPVDRRKDIPEAKLPPRKRFCSTAPTSRYEVGESSTAAPKPTGGHRVEYGFIDTLYAKTRCQRAEEVGYGIRDVWADLREAVEELASTTLEGVNARVTEFIDVQELDIQDIYVVIEDTQDRQTQLFQRIDGLVEDRQFHQETTLLLDQEALASREAWAYSVGLSSAVHFELQAYRTHTQMQDYRIASQESLTAALSALVSLLQGQLSAALGQIRALQARDQTHEDDHEGAASMTVGLVSSFLVSNNHNNIPPRRSSATARATAAAATPMTAAAVEQLIEARVSAALANHETLQNNTNGVVVLSQWFKKMESVFHISNCDVENQVKFATCTFLGNALTWWNSYMKTITQDVAYATDWKALKKMMPVKYYPRGEIKKLEIELWNLKVKGTDVASYTLHLQQLALMCGRMFHEESDEVKKYVGGLLDMIRGNVMSYQPKMMEKAIEFANDQMDQKVLTIAERQAEHKR